MCGAGCLPAAPPALLARYRADIAILGACAIHAQLGLSASRGRCRNQTRHAGGKHRALAGRRSYEAEPLRAASGGRINRHTSVILDKPWEELGDTARCRSTLLTLNNVERVMNKVIAREGKTLILR